MINNIFNDQKFKKILGTNENVSDERSLGSIPINKIIIKVHF